LMRSRVKVERAKRVETPAISLVDFSGLRAL
jgi:hypothetical protein